ncbi:DUF6512 family protein [Chloroflexota bacterium]
MDRYILKWEIGGVVFVFLLGALLHFLFEWTGEAPPVGAIASVNESVWEHFKQGFWPMCLYAAIEYRFLSGRSNNFLVAKAAAVYLMPVFTGLAFYAYTAVTGEHFLIVDILLFLAAIILGQFVSYRILTMKKLPRYLSGIAIAAIITLAVILVLFTYTPPQMPIFLDETGFYGLPR